MRLTIWALGGYQLGNIRDVSVLLENDPHSGRYYYLFNGLDDSSRAIDVIDNVLLGN